MWDVTDPQTPLLFVGPKEGLAIAFRRQRFGLGCKEEARLGAMLYIDCFCQSLDIAVAMLVCNTFKFSNYLF